MINKHWYSLLHSLFLCAFARPRLTEQPSNARKRKRECKTIFFHIEKPNVWKITHVQLSSWTCITRLSLIFFLKSFSHKEFKLFFQCTCSVIRSFFSVSLTLSPNLNQSTLLCCAWILINEAIPGASKVREFLCCN